MIWSDEDQYYKIIESSGLHFIIFGEVGEQWTDEVLNVFEAAGVKVNLFPWASVIELRLQLEIVCYPYIQLWKNGSLRGELEGYKNEELQHLIVYSSTSNA